MLLKNFKKVLWLKLILVLVSLFLFFYLFKNTKAKFSDLQKPNSVVFILDLSNSMNVEDIDWKYWLPTTRLNIAKFFIENKISNWVDQRVWLIVFAKNASYFLPPTKDRDTFLAYLKTLNTNLLSQWTNIYSWLDLFVNYSFSWDIWIVLSDFGGKIDNLEQVNVQKNYLDNLAKKYFLKKQKLIFIWLWTKKGWIVKDANWKDVLQWWEKIFDKRNDDFWKELARYFKTQYYPVDSWDKLKNIKILDNVKFEKSDKKMNKLTIISILVGLLGL